MTEEARRPRPRVILGVSGGIAAYKACGLLRLLTESGHDVRVVPTAAALTFVGEATWAALSGHPVATSVWQDVHEVPHVRLGQTADLVVVAPATADLLARAAHGRADDLEGGCRRHHPDVVPGLGQQPQQRARLVGGDAAGHPEHDPRPPGRAGTRCRAVLVHGRALPVDPERVRPRSARRRAGPR